MYRIGYDHHEGRSAAGYRAGKPLDSVGVRDCSGFCGEECGVEGEQFGYGYCEGGANGLAENGAAGLREGRGYGREG